MKRGRWSGKSKGGRRAYRLDTDPDCWVIVAALWFRHDPKDQRSFAVLQALNVLLAPHDSIEVAPLGHALSTGSRNAASA
jgi:hypothetical protein